MGGRGSSGGSGGGSGSGGFGRSLPELTGSEKQVSWAKDIRNNAFLSLKQLDKDIDMGFSITKGNVRKATKKDVDSVRKLLDIGFRSEQAKSAKWIIESRGNFSDRSLRNMVIDEAREGAISQVLKQYKKRKK